MGWDPTIDPRTITPTRKHLEIQERLRAEANQIEVISKTQAGIAGFVVTLDPHTGDLTCTCPLSPDCRHTAAIRERALRRIER
jgi:hypothetical protein